MSDWLNNLTGLRAGFSLLPSSIFLYLGGQRHTFVLLLCHGSGFKLTTSLELIILSDEYAEMHRFFQPFVLRITKHSPLRWLKQILCSFPSSVFFFLLPPSSSSLTLHPSPSISLFSSLLLPCYTPSPLLLHRFVSHSDRLSLHAAGDPQCVCVLPGGHTPRCHHFSPGEFHGGCAAPSPAEHRAEDPGGGCRRGHAGPGPGGSNSCAGEFRRHR